MKITFDIRKPNQNGFSSSSFMFSDENKMAQLVKETGEIFVCAMTYSKTVVETEISCGEHKFICGIIPKGAEHLKYHHIEYYSYIHGHRSLDHFKVTKKQGGEQYKEYITAVLNQKLGEYLGADFELTVHITDWFGLFND